MIIFDLDDTLADCEHRRHLVDYWKYQSKLFKSGYLADLHEKEFKPDWKAFYEACDKDTPIKPVVQIYSTLIREGHEVEIWSGRCESVRDKTVEWLHEHCPCSSHIKLRMRPVGDSTPDNELKKRWLEETYEETKWGSRTSIEYVFDDRPKVIRMWREHGIFVFNCCQHDEEF